MSLKGIKRAFSTQLPECNLKCNLSCEQLSGSLPEIYSVRSAANGLESEKYIYFNSILHLHLTYLMALNKKLKKTTLTWSCAVQPQTEQSHTVLIAQAICTL